MYTLKDVRASLTAEKKSADGLWTTFVLRPLSIPLTLPALAAGLSANAVSYLSVLFSLAGGVLFALPGYAAPLWGAALLNGFSLMDCVDGNVARVRGTASPWGGWADAVMGFVAYTAVFLSTGVYLYHRTAWWPWLLAAGLTSSANLLTRVSYQIYKNIVGPSAHGSVSFERKLAENVGVTGFMMPALIIFHAFSLTTAMETLVLFNLAFYLGGCAVSVVKVARKASAAA